jgi:hypothetical protein
MRAPFQYFGGKRLVAGAVWRGFGEVHSYVEPFAGSMAVLLARPHPPGREVVNDLDGHVVNFWRACQADPLGVWRFAHCPVSELDVTARHKWLRVRHDLVRRLGADPGYYDVQVAGWWVYGLSAWIGGTATWCRVDKPLYQQLPQARPGGVHTFTFDELSWLAQRLQSVVLPCGDWQRVLSDSYLFGGSKTGITGVLLDPPYDAGEDGLYANDDKSISARVREWALANGDNPRLRIALCGYEGEHTMPKSWRVLRWKNQGGYKHQGDRERVWFSPHCEAVGRSR